MSQFGECPECGKQCLLVIGKEYDILGKEIGIRVKCVNCGYAKTLYW